MNRSKKVATLNVPALWSPIPVKGMVKKVYTERLPFERDGELQIASEEQSVIRYAKNFKIGSLEFSLFMFSDESNQSKVSKFFTDLTKELTPEQIGGALSVASSAKFTYLDNVYGEKK